MRIRKKQFWNGSFICAGVGLALAVSTVRDRFAETPVKGCAISFVSVAPKEFETVNKLV